ncbi:MAG: RNA polymerase sigma factor RpoD/SigA [Oscillospiraceae bacterium]
MTTPGSWRFSTYATKWIRQGISRCLMNHAGLIRVPVHTAERMRAILAARAAWIQANGQEPDLEQLAGTVGLPPEKVAKLLSLVPEISSLDAPTGDGDGTVGQLLPDRAARGPQDILVQAQLLQAITSLMAQLTQRQQQILRMHYGLDDGVCHSLEDIAGQLGISKERVRQVEKQAFEKMKTLGASMGLEEYLRGSFRGRRRKDHGNGFGIGMGGAWLAADDGQSAPGERHTGRAVFCHAGGGRRGGGSGGGFDPDCPGSGTGCVQATPGWTGGSRGAAGPGGGAGPTGSSPWGLGFRRSPEAVLAGSWRALPRLNSLDARELTNGGADPNRPHRGLALAGGPRRPWTLPDRACCFWI